jgi:hypothetical protein
LFNLWLHVAGSETPTIDRRPAWRCRGDPVRLAESVAGDGRIAAHNHLASADRFNLVIDGAV